ncbi:MAG: hypothetical protein ABIL68_07365 [bacterium]
MKKRKICLVGTVVMILFGMTDVMGQCVGDKDETSKYNDPCRLFSIPTTDILPMGNISLGGGQSFGRLNSEFLTRVSFGTAPYTEIQLNTQKIVDRFKNGSRIKTVAVPAIKFRVPYLGDNSSYIPSIALALRHNLRWVSEDYKSDDIQYQYLKSWTSLFLVGSKTFFLGNIPELSVYAGWKMNSVRIKLTDHNDHKIVPVEKDYYHRNLNGFCGGMKLKTARRAWMMVEFEPIPSLPAPKKVGNHLIVEESGIDRVWLVTVGTRYFINHILGFDVGAQYRSDKPNIADMNVLFGLNVTFSTLRKRNS